MEIAWLIVYRALLLIAAMFGLLLIYQARNRLDKPGVKPLLMLVTGSLFYIGVKLTVSFVRGTPTVFVITRFNPLGAGLATVGFFLLVVEYTGIEQPVSRRTAALLLIEPVVVSSLVWIDLEYLWKPIRQDPSTLSGYAWEVTSIAIANQLYMNILLIFGGGLLLWFAIQSDTVFKTQMAALLLAVIGPIVGNFVYYVGYIPFNLTPVMFVFSGLIITGAILRADLLDIVPIGRSVVINDLDAGVLTIDRDHRLIDTNESSHQIFGFDDPDSLVGQHIDDVFAEHPSFRDLYWSITDDDSDLTSPVELEGRYFSVEAVSLGNAEDTLLGRTIIMRDVTNQTLREQELERKTEQLERFASVLSHDLRNPLNVASGRLKLAREEHDNEHFSAISDAHDRMETLISDVLTLAQEGETVSEFESIDLPDLLESCWFNVETGAATLQIETDQVIRADPSRVRQLIENLFANAIEHGREDVTVTIGDLADGFYVEDDGPGIPEETREQVFEMGYTTGQGTGFGLNIVEQITTAHGWEVTITEGTNGGARFEFTGVECVDE
jgi:signal transduction histidine kinase